MEKSGNIGLSKLVGYSAFDLWEECYEYNEDACYIANDKESLKKFLIGAMLPFENYRLDSITISDMIKDFGCSCGEYALEPKAWIRFERIAQEREVKYNVEKYDDGFGGQSELVIVTVEELNIPND